MSDESSSTGSESTAEVSDTPAERVADGAQIPQQPSPPTVETRPAPVLPVFPPLPAPVVDAAEPAPQVSAEPEPAVVAVTAQSGPPPAELFAPKQAAPAQPEPSTTPEPAVPERSVPEPAADLAPPAVPADSTEAGEQRPASKKGLLIGAGFAVIVLGLLALVAWLIYVKFYFDPMREAQPGHCLADLPIVPVGEEAEADNARFVDCREADATYRVVGRVDDVTEAAATDPAVCDGFRDLAAIYRAVPSGGTGYVLCLSQVEHD